MAKRVRFLRDWEFWPRPSVVVAHSAGEEKRLPEAQVDAALADKAIEVLDGDADQRPGQAAREARRAAD